MLTTTSHQFLAFSFSPTNFPSPFVSALHYNTLLFSSQLLDLDEVPMTSRRKRRAAAGAHVTVPFLNLVKVLGVIQCTGQSLSSEELSLLVGQKDIEVNMPGLGCSPHSQAVGETAWWQLLWSDKWIVFPKLIWGTCTNFLAAEVNFWTCRVAMPFLLSLGSEARAVQMFAVPFQHHMFHSFLLGLDRLHIFVNNRHSKA